jgi:membrane protein
LASSVAYYALLSVFPLVLLGTAVAASFLDEAQIRAGLAAALTTYLPPEAAEAVQRTVAETVRVRRPAGLLALLVFLWSGSAAAGAVRHALNRLLGVTAARPFWRRKLVELGATLLFAALLGASLSLAVARAVLVRLAPQLGPHVARLLPEVEALGRLGPPLFGLLTFALAYRILPARRLPWRPLAAGALAAAALFEVARAVAFRALAGFARYELVYGSLAGAIVFLVWVYAAALILLVGAAVAVCAAREGRGPA